ncbi:SURF1 family protein [Curtobacterium poinsettiae]|uniref:SURF1 family cytochrome oxidase biogenesis protein n=1 Tax=Curtobacterium poinsettiae TaxID=159612 RepID=UPI00217EEB64|nr:SURF1 family protein [Curtobacterium flaccumfaciens]MCS6575052.1 SURF1 family protein [Curtobacterium flaccumfaciens pv. flaccumfaciens]MCU0154000.1 SURF1 family protein [Curtobacterium flaccumfaciens pv. poinsettiae]MDD1384437.1 SURF1 family protein [Curtobacterium flaccumfaciens pv. poinsettiae]UXN14096.1 SURF1 family protein [Curtobacterium flaccumfaciens pv. poinsettiae]
MTDGFDPQSRYGRKHAAKLQRAAAGSDPGSDSDSGSGSTGRSDEPFVGWRFVRSRRWLGYFAIAVAFAIVCTLFGMWQWDRRNEAVRQNEQVAQNYDHTPVPLDRALPRASSWQDEQEWLRVSVTGRYDVDSQLLVRNRVHNGQPGFEVLTPLVTSEGRAFIVDRGWVPTGNAQDAPDHVPAPPSGEVTAVVRLQQSEPRIPGRSDPKDTDQVQSVTLADVANKVDDPIWTGAYGQLASESPAPTEARPLGWDRPNADTGLHLSYFIQWFLFAAGGFGFLAYVMVQEYRNLNQDDPEERERALERERRKNLKPKTDAEIEDELIASRR